MSAAKHLRQQRRRYEGRTTNRAVRRQVQREQNVLQNVRTHEVKLKTCRKGRPVLHRISGVEWTAERSVWAVLARLRFVNAIREERTAEVAVATVRERHLARKRGGGDELTRRLVQRLLGRAAARVVKGAGGEDPDLPTPEDLRSVFGLEEGETK